MAERYWITGVQLGIIKAHLDRLPDVEQPIKVLEEVENQFIGNYPTDKDKKCFLKKIEKAFHRDKEK